MKRFQYSLWVAALATVLIAACSSSDIEKADRLAREGKTEEAIALYEGTIDGGSIEAISYLKPLVDDGDTTQIYALGRAYVELERACWSGL